MQFDRVLLTIQCHEWHANHLAHQSHQMLTMLLCTLSAAHTNSKTSFPLFTHGEISHL